MNGEGSSRGVKRPFENNVQREKEDFGACSIQKCIKCKQESDSFVPVVCSHVFCTLCYNQLFTDLEPGTQAHCPEDGRVIDPDYGVISTATGGGESMLVPNIKMPCTNKERGCNKMMFFHDMKVHLDNCVFRLVSNCPQHCSQTFMYKDLVKHLTTSCDCRLVKCQFCQEYVGLDQMEKHELQCPQKPVTCHYCNMEKILLKELDHHIQSCPMSPGLCLMREIGCTFEGTKKDIEEHQKSWPYHMDVIVKSVTALQGQLNELSSRFDELQHHSSKPHLQTQSSANTSQKRMKDNSTVCVDGIYLWQLKSISETVATKQDFVSPRFYMYEQGYHMRLYLRIYKEVTLRIVVEEGRNDSSLSWPFAQKMTVMILDQYADKHRTVEVDPKASTENFRCHQEWKTCKWMGEMVRVIEPDELLCKGSPYVRNNSINIKFKVFK